MNFQKCMLKYMNLKTIINMLPTMGCDVQTYYNKHVSTEVYRIVAYTIRERCEFHNY